MSKNSLTNSKGPLDALLGLIGNLQLAWRLFEDPRVPIWVKSIPVLAVAYLIWPLDLLADPVLGLGQLDDLGVILLGMKLFLTLSPANVIEELKQRSATREEPIEPSDDEVIDTTFRVLDQDQH